MATDIEPKGRKYDGFIEEDFKGTKIIILLVINADKSILFNIKFKFN